jgi:hypothetical protein
LLLVACESEPERAAAPPPAAIAPAGDDRPLSYDRALVADDVAGRSVASLLLMEASILARAGMVFQRRWLDWHFAGQPARGPMGGREGGVAGYQGTGFDESRLTATDRSNLELVRAAIARLPRPEMRARYRELMARHGNAIVDTSRTGRLRLTDDGRHLVFVDADDAHPARAWRVSDGRRVGRMPMPTSEDMLSTREVLSSGAVWAQWVPTPAGSNLGVWDLVADERRAVHRVYDRAAQQRDDYSTDGVVLAVSGDGRRAAVAYRRGIVVRGGDGFARVAALKGVASDSVVRRTPFDDGVISGEEISVNGRAAFSGDGQLLTLLVVADGRSRLRVFRVKDGAPVRDLTISVKDLADIDVDRTGRRIVGHAPAERRFLVWDDSGEHVIDAGPPIDQVAISADGALALVARAARLELRDLATGAARWSIQLSAPARLLAVSGAAGLVAHWSDLELVVADLASGKPLPTFAGHRSWPSPEVQREAIVLATALEDDRPPMYEAEMRDPFREPDALLAELSPTYLAALPRGQLSLLPDLIEAVRGKPLAPGPAAAVVQAWKGGCDGWYGDEDPDYTPDELLPVDRRNLAAIRSEIAGRGAATAEDRPSRIRPAHCP